MKCIPVVFSVFFLVGASQAVTLFVGQGGVCDLPKCTVQAAIDAARPGDTVMIMWEAPFPEYHEHIVIDKPITLTSDWLPDNRFYERPTISCNLNMFDEVIHVTHPGVTIRNLRIRSTTPIEASPGDDLDMRSDAGIRIDEGDTTVEHCEIMRCRIGILVENSGGRGLNTRIDDCTIGRLYPHEWFAPQFPLVHDGNFFGIVRVAPSAAMSTAAASTTPDRISNCTIARNRFFGIVLIGGDAMLVSNNTIAYNGTSRPEVSPGQYGDGGILCLPDEDPSGQTAVSRSGTVITANTIDRNEGQAISIISGDSDQTSHEPIVLNNTIGTLTSSDHSGWVTIQH